MGRGGGASGWSGAKQGAGRGQSRRTGAQMALRSCPRGAARMQWDTTGQRSMYRARAASGSEGHLRSEGHHCGSGAQAALRHPEDGVVTADARGRTPRSPSW